MSSPEPLPPTLKQPSADETPFPEFGATPQAAPNLGAVPQPAPMYLEPPNSPMAIGSLILGILGFFALPVIGSIAAVVLGHMARNEIQRANGTVGGRSLATIGLVLGYIGIGIFALIVILVVVLIVIGLVFVTHGGSTS